MKITTNKDQLLPALIRAGTIVERRQTLPILANFLVEVNQGLMTLTGSDLEVEVRTQITVEASEDFSFTVPARKLTDICKSLDDGAEIVLEVGGDKVTIRSGRGRYTLTTLPAEDYPRLELTTPQEKITLAPDKLKKLIEKTAFAMAQKDVRYYLQGMLFEGRPGRLRTVATDGHRLALCDVDLDSEQNPNIQVIVPRKAVLELNRLLSVEDALPITLEFSTSFMKADLPDGSFATKLIDGRYPDYAKVLPNVDLKSMVADRELLQHALQRTAILSNEKFRGVRFRLEPGLLELQAHNPEHEEAVEELEVAYQGEPITIGFNVGYLLDILNVLEKPQVNMGFIDATSSCLVTAQGDDQCRYVVMPMRI